MVLSQVEIGLFLQVVHELGYHKGRIVAGSDATNIHRYFHDLNDGLGALSMKGDLPKSIQAWLQHFGNDGLEPIFQSLDPTFKRASVAVVVAIIVTVLNYKGLQYIRHSKWFKALVTHVPQLYAGVRVWLYQKAQWWRAACLQEHSLIQKSALAATAAAGAAAAPTVTVSAVTAAGFTSSGIAAGSTAAGMMSSAAAASGGGVAAGSAVATCQAVGATGSLAAAGTAVTVGVMCCGAVAAVGLGYGCYKLYKRARAPATHSQTPKVEAITLETTSTTPALPGAEAPTEIRMIPCVVEPTRDTRVSDSSDAATMAVASPRRVDDCRGRFQVVCAYV